jgi:hypothetical protein
VASWYLAPSLAVLRDEINRRWPGRDRTSDGTIGDAAHQATRSDHNPNARGSVNAFDIDEDGIDLAAVFAAVRRHPSARYWIYEGWLYHRDRGWRPETYTGPNPHDRHAHLSIDQTVAAEQDRRPWGLLEDELTKDELVAACRIAVHGLLKEAADGSTATGRQVRDYLRAVVPGAELAAGEVADTIGRRLTGGSA